MRRVPLVLVVVLSLVTAGCNSFTSSEPNPAPKTPTELSGQLAPICRRDDSPNRDVHGH